MMNYTYIDVTTKIKKLGFVEKRKAKGDHVIWAHTIYPQEISLPNHGKKTLSKGVIKAVITVTGKSNIDFAKL